MQFTLLFVIPLIYCSFVESKRIRAYEKYKSIYNETTWDKEIQPILEDLVREERQLLRDQEAIDSILSISSQEMKADENETLKPIKVTVTKSATMIEEKPKATLKNGKPEKLATLGKPNQTEFRLKRRAKVFPRKPRNNPGMEGIPKLNSKFFIRTTQLLNDRKAIINELAKNEKFNRNSRKMTTTEAPIATTKETIFSERSIENLNEELTPEEIDDIIGAAILNPTPKAVTLGNPNAKETKSRVFEYPLSRVPSSSSSSSSSHILPSQSIPPFQPPIDEMGKVKTIEDNIREFIQFRTTTTLPKKGPKMDMKLFPVRIDGAERPVLAKSIPVASKTIEELKIENQEILKEIEAALERPEKLNSNPQKQLMIPAEVPISEVSLNLMTDDKISIDSTRSNLSKLLYTSLPIDIKEMPSRA